MPVINRREITQEEMPVLPPVPRQLGTPPEVLISERIPVSDCETTNLPEFIPSGQEVDSWEPEPSFSVPEQSQRTVIDPEPLQLDVDQSAPLSMPRRSSRVNKGVNNRYSEYFTGSQFDEETHGQFENIQCVFGNYFHNFSDSQEVSQIVGYQNNSPVQPVYRLEDTSGYGPLYAIPLVPEQQDRKALWTENGWIWL